MPQRDRIRGGVKTNLVSSGMLAGARGTDVDVSAIASLLHGSYQVQQCSGGSVLLRVVMNFPRPCPVGVLIFQQLSRQLGKLAEHRHSNGEIWTPHQTTARLLDPCGHFS